MSPFPAEGRGWGGAEGQKAPPEPASLPAEVPAATRLAGRCGLPHRWRPRQPSTAFCVPPWLPLPGPGARSGSSRCLGQGGRKGGGERQVSGSRMRAEWGLLRNPAPERCVPEAPQDLRALPRSQGAPRAARESLAAGDVGCKPPRQSCRVGSVPHPSGPHVAVSWQMYPESRWERGRGGEEARDEAGRGLRGARVPRSGPAPAPRWPGARTWPAPGRAGPSRPPTGLEGGGSEGVKAQGSRPRPGLGPPPAQVVLTAEEQSPSPFVLGAP